MIRESPLCLHSQLGSFFQEAFEGDHGTHMCNTNMNTVQQLRDPRVNVLLRRVQVLGTNPF